MESKKYIKYYDNGSIMWEEWRLPNGNLHKEDGPAKIRYYTDGNKESEQWYKNGLYHREDGPSYRRWDVDGSIISEAWEIDGNYHREDGPATVRYNKDGNIGVNYYISNCFLTEEEWKIRRLPNTKIKRALYK